MGLNSAGVTIGFTANQTGTYAGTTLTFAPNVTYSLPFTVGDSADMIERLGFLEGTATTTPADVVLTDALAPLNGGGVASFNGVRFMLIRNLSATIALNVVQPAGDAWDGTGSPFAFATTAGLAGGDLWFAIPSEGIWVHSSPNAAIAIGAANNTITLASASSTVDYQIWMFGNVA